MAYLRFWHIYWTFSEPRLRDKVMFAETPVIVEEVDAKRSHERQAHLQHCKDFVPRHGQQRYGGRKHRHEQGRGNQHTQLPAEQCKPQRQACREKAPGHSFVDCKRRQGKGGGLREVPDRVRTQCDEVKRTSECNGEQQPDPDRRRDLEALKNALPKDQAECRSEHTNPNEASGGRSREPNKRYGQNAGQRRKNHECLSIIYRAILIEACWNVRAQLNQTVGDQRIGIGAARLAQKGNAKRCEQGHGKAQSGGNALETGYQYMMEPDQTLKTYGIWNVAYSVFNGFYLFVQGFHAEFDAEKLRLTGLDNAGTGIMAASPWLLYVLLAPWRRDAIISALTIAGMAGLMLFYHSNGYTQFNTQRYTMDWMALAQLMMAFAFTPSEMKPGRAELLKPLVLWGMGLNVAMLAVLAVAP